MGLRRFLYHNFIKIFTVFLYLTLAGNYGELFFWNWDAKETFPFFLLLFSVIAPTFYIYFFGKIAPEGMDSEKPFNFKKYNSSGFVDIFLGHYSNVATIGLFFTALVYFGSRILQGSLSAIINIPLTSIYIFIIALYVPVALRIMVYAQFKYENRFVATLFVLCFWCFDHMILTMLIDIAPSIYKAVKCVT